MSEIKEIQNIELEILKEIKRICEKYSLTYFLVGGTFLGAVRHKGFIPWDEDADIGMPRKDYEKFCEIANTSELNAKYTFKSYKNDERFYCYNAKIMDESLRLVNNSATKEQIVFPWIDIFPFDGMPNNEILKYMHFLNFLFNRLFFNFSCFDDIVQIKKDRPLYERILIWIGKNMPVEKLFNTRKCLEKIDKNLKKYSYENSKYVANFIGQYKVKEILPKRIFDELVDYQFETITLKAPKDYDTFLKRIYGKDYMTPPPEDKRGGHNLKVIEK